MGMSRRDAEQETVLVGTDLSARSDRAIDRALLLSKEFGARLMVLHAIEPYSLLKRDQTRADKAIRDVLPDPEADVDVLPAIGPAPAALVAAAENGNCALVVMGVARMNHLGDYFIGTAVDHVIRSAPCPVLVVKRRPHRAYRTIAVAVDCSPCSQAALLTAARMFPAASIHVIHAFHVPYEGWLRSDDTRDDFTGVARAELKAMLAAPEVPEDVRARTQLHLEYGEVHKVLLEATDRLGVDLVVMGTHGRGGFIRSMVGSRAEELLRCLPGDTMLVRQT
ncbi:universal stress protein [Novosphingobium subterraneum]|jgi:nucleotide-binding universal stress UspA family protein|uniref:UspA domain-containing protein n=1 Tax=Novosphingobium subterraneum TaxID=48936 RepID=A0A0B8ZX99_9SPHN|nr:universal stress protein [Novosphingobium subterraneum]KHS42908.1 UspA domain-containing protein [Novosphingobium subterraneum]